MAYSQAWGVAQAYKDLLSLLAGSEALVLQLTKQVKEGPQQYAIGTRGKTTPTT